MELDDDSPRPEALLVLSLARGRYALGLGQVAGLAACGPLRGVPLAPPVVPGLTEWRGRLLTVVDLPAILGEGPRGRWETLVRIAPPHEHTALFVPGPVHLIRDGACGGAECARLDPAAILARIEQGG
jgi:chemotaxis signal transduction protein